MKKLKSESGRSMVEMLGVLAIIGVLSVGGIAGYSLSMRRHRANAVVDIASKYALVTYSQCQQAVMDGLVSSVTGCGCYDNYTDVDIGPLPAGVNQMVAVFNIDEKTKTDLAIVQTLFNDNKLCQAVASITGTACSGGSVNITIKQN